MRVSRLKRTDDVGRRRISTKNHGGWRLAGRRIFRWGMAIGIMVAVVGGGWLWQQRDWRGNERLNLTIIGPTQNRLRPVWWLTFDPVAKKGLVLVFTQDVVVETVGGYGNYRAWAVPALAEVENKGFSLIEATFQELLGLRSGGVVVVRTEMGEKAAKWIKLAAVENLLVYGKGNMKLADRWRWWWLTRGLNEQSIEAVVLSQTKLVQPKELPDGEQILEIDMMRLDSYLQRTVRDEEVAAEGVSVAVVNQTRYGQLGARVARMLVNSSVDVVSVDSRVEELKNTKIIVGDKRWLKSLTLRRIRDLLPSSHVEVGDIEGERFDILVWVGEDYWKWLNTVGK